MSAPLAFLLTIWIKRKSLCSFFGSRGRSTIMKTKLALCAMIVCIASAVVVGQQVSVNYNHSQSFSPFHTYAWGSNNTNQIQNSILTQMAQQNIDATLQNKGLQKVQKSQKPNLILTANDSM